MTHLYLLVLVGVGGVLCYYAIAFNRPCVSNRCKVLKLEKIESFFGFHKAASELKLYT
jgi:hypothetical protein